MSQAGSKVAFANSSTDAEIDARRNSEPGLTSLKLDTSCDGSDARYDGTRELWKDDRFSVDNARDEGDIRPR